MNRTITTCALLSVFAAVPRAADAAVPTRVPVQGFLTDATGEPIDGSAQIEVRLYDVSTGGVAWFTESHSVGVDHGELTVYLGSAQPLDLAGFEGGTAYLGVTIVGEAEMTPRLPIGTVPYAAYAQETAAVPPGAVMMFDLDACPAGWSALTEARGRALVGAPGGGTVLGAVGTAFTDLENRGHAHGVPALSGTTSSAGAHTHAVSGSTTSATVSWAHTHSIDPPAHQHRWATYHNVLAVPSNLSTWSTYSSGDTSSGGEIDLEGYSDGLGTEGSGEYPLARGSEAGAFASVYYTQMTDQGSFTSGGASTSSGTHAHDLTGATAASDGAHTHTCSTGEATSLGATTADVMPYLQLLVCRKE